MNKLLKTTVCLNALSCLGFGITFALMPEPIAVFLDGVLPLILRLVGIGLALNGAHLMIASFRNKIGRLELGYFILGDAIWVLASLAMIAWPQVIHSPSAIVSTLAVAILVGSFAVLQTRCGWDVLKQSHS